MSRAIAAPGDLDTTFGTDGTGVVLTEIPGWSAEEPVPRSLLVDTVAERIIVAAAVERAEGQPRRAYVFVGYKENGVLDRDFGDKGVALLLADDPLAGRGGLGALNPFILFSSRLFLLGDYEDGLVLAGFTQDGELDPTFGTSAGTVRTSLPGSPGNHFPRAVALQNDGHILAAATDGANGELQLARYTIDGKPDLTFGTTEGLATVDEDSAFIEVHLAVRPDNRIVVLSDMNYSRDLFLLEFSKNGQINSSFGDDGSVVTRLQGLFEPRGLLLQRDGGIVALGDWDCTLARHTAKGEFDSTFGLESGVFTLHIPGGTVHAKALFAEPDGKILVAAEYYSLQDTLILVRLTADGRPDPSFGGVVMTGMARVPSVISRDDDGILVAGSDNGRIFLARFLGGENSDTSSSSTSSTTTTNTSTTTTTTNALPGPPCGDGVVGPGEVCDPSAPGQDAGCCINNCSLSRALGQPCRQTEALGACHQGSSCDGSGRCVHTPRLANEPCRSPGVSGACDQGDACDGSTLECPLGGTEAGCAVEIGDVQGLVVRATCEARVQDGVETRDTACEADGTAGEADATFTAAASSSADEVIDSVSKTLKFRKKRQLRSRVLKLKLNARGRELLRKSSSGFLFVRVNVKVVNGPKGNKSVTRLLRFLQRRR
jgi:uncharacterized delta-60 repeat protein